MSNRPLTLLPLSTTSLKNLPSLILAKDTLAPGFE